MTRLRHSGNDMPTIPPPSVLKWLESLARWCWRVVHADHTQLYGMNYTRASAGWRHFYIAVACAPSRRFRRPRPVKPRDALDLLNTAIPGGFTPPPNESRAEVIAYTTPAEGEDDRSRWEPLRAGRV